VNDDYATVAYEGSSGKRVWAATHDVPVGGEDVPASLAVSPDGSTIYVTGSSETESVTEYVTVAYDSADGAERWVAHFAGPGDGANEASSVTANADGSAVFVTGSASVGASLDFSTVAYEASNGRELWVATYGRAATFDGAGFVLASPDGSTVFVTGQSTGRTRADDYATVAYSASTGDQLWVARYNGPGDSVDAARRLAIDPDGSTLYVTGESVGKSEGFDYATVAYDSATGTRLWTARYDGPTSADDLATSIAVNPNGATVYVTGSAVYGTRISATIDHGTVAYDAATGARLWLAHYDGPVHEHEAAAALVVDPDGSTVYVTGESEGVSSHRLDLLPLDYATLAYRA
jgi:DNA-binding beta-propeller fold protein YncE